MFGGMDLEFLARSETWYREAVLYPAIAQRAQLQRALRRPAWRHVAGWHLGSAVVRFGERLRTTAAREMATSP